MGSVRHIANAIPANRQIMLDSLNLERMPNGVLELILSKTTPRTATMLSPVSKTFKAAAYDDLVWKAFLPRDVNDLVQNIRGKLSYSSLKELYFVLSSCHHLLGDGPQAFWLDRETSAVCRAFSARTSTLTVVRGDEDWWQWGHEEGSRFEESARLKTICWLEVKGEIKTRLRPGMYTFSWVLKLDRNHYGLQKPVTFCTTDASGDLAMEEKRMLRVKPTRLEAIRSGERSSSSWTCYNVRHFAVEKSSRLGNADAESMQDVTIGCAFRDIWNGNWKSGLLVDGVLIREGIHRLDEDGDELGEEEKLASSRGNNSGSIRYGIRKPVRRNRR